MNGDHNVITMPSQRFIDTVIDDFEHHMVQATTIRGIADVHPRALADSF